MFMCTSVDSSHFETCMKRKHWNNWNNFFKFLVWVRVQVHRTNWRSTYIHAKPCACENRHIVCSHNGTLAYVFYIIATACVTYTQLMRRGSMCLSHNGTEMEQKCTFNQEKKKRRIASLYSINQSQILDTWKWYANIVIWKQARFNLLKLPLVIHIVLQTSALDALKVETHKIFTGSVKIFLFGEYLVITKM